MEKMFCGNKLSVKCLIITKKYLITENKRNAAKKIAYQVPVIINHRKAGDPILY